MAYDPKIHHRRSIRLKGYDYTNEGLYFITLCTQNRLNIFGAITEQQMILNEAGKHAHQCWLAIPDHFPNVVLHDFVIMPNHIHGIIELTNKERAKALSPKEVRVENLPLEDVRAEDLSSGKVRAENLLPQLEHNLNIVRAEDLPPQQPILGSIVKGYKIGVTKWFRNHNNAAPQPSIWQRNYFEHIIRNEQSYNRISEYIVNNPANWDNDKLYAI